MRGPSEARIDEAQEAPDLRSTQEARFRTMVYWFGGAAALIAALQVIEVYRLRTVETFVFLGLAAGFVALAPLVLAMNRRGKTQGAALVVSGFMMIAGPIVGWYIRTVDVLPLILPGIGIVATFSYVDTRRLNNVLVVAWLSMMVTLGLLQLKPGAWNPITTTSGTIAHMATGIVLGVLLIVFAFQNRSVQARLAAVEETNLKLNEATNELKTAQAARARFMNNAAHELNTPLTPILMQLDILRRRHEEAPDEKTQRSLEVLERSMARLRHLIGDVLEAARMNTETLHVEMRRVDLTRLLDEAAEEFAGPFQSRRIDLERHIAPRLVVTGDPIRLRQVVDNLLTNALKFTPEDGLVTLAAEREDGHVTVSVRDNGPGVPPKYARSIFEPFTRLARTSPLSQQGSGLGLFICQGIVEQHGGEIWLESGGAGLGATFSFRLPRRPVEDQDDHDETESEIEADDEDPMLDAPMPMTTRGSGQEPPPTSPRDAGENTIVRKRGPTQDEPTIPDDLRPGP